MAIKKTNANEKGNERYLAIKIRVIDTGIGITKEGIKKLFIDFGKLDENSKRNS
jgi:signal transduction histidine kinase